MAFSNIPDIQRRRRDLGLGLQLNASTKFGKILDMGTATPLPSTWSAVAMFRILALPSVGSGSIIFANIVNSAATVTTDKWEMRAISSGSTLELASYATLTGGTQEKKSFIVDVNLPAHVMILTYDGTTLKLSVNGGTFTSHSTGYRTHVSVWGTNAVTGTPNNPGSGGGGIIVGGNLLNAGTFTNGGIIGSFNFLSNLVLTQDDAIKIWNGGKLSDWISRQYPSATSLLKYDYGDDAGDTSSLVKNVANPGTNDLTLYGTPSYTTVQY